MTAQAPVTVSYSTMNSSQQKKRKRGASTGIPGTVVLPAGVNSASVSVYVSNPNRKRGGSETMTLSSGTGYAVSLPSSATVTITN